MTKLRPLGDKILIKPREEVYKGLLEIPKSAKKDPIVQGEVMAVGPGMLMNSGERWPMPCKPGDVVIFEKFAGQDIELDGVKYKVLRDDAIQAVITTPQDG